MLIRILAVIALVISSDARESHCEEPLGERVTHAQGEAWVQRLANRSPRPFEGYIHRPPRNVDREALEDVKVAYDKLSQNFELALPALIAGLDDDRYSYYQEVPSNGVFHCHSVGRACREIVRSHVEIYHSYLTILDDTGVPRRIHFLTKMGGIEKWYSTRKQMPLLKMQLEAIDWALKQPPALQVADKRDEWKAALESLRKFRYELAQAKKPFDPKARLWFEGK